MTPLHSVKKDTVDEGYSNYVIGNVLMISEGRSGSDNVFTLRDGTVHPLRAHYSSGSCYRLTYL